MSINGVPESEPMSSMVNACKLYSVCSVQANVFVLDTVLGHGQLTTLSKSAHLILQDYSEIS